MIEINGKLNEFILDLNEFPYEEHSLIVSSFTHNGSFQAWGVEMNTLDAVKTDIKGKGILHLKTPLEAIKKEGLIVIRNYANERIRIVLKPNLEALRPKEYKFEMANMVFSGRNLSFDIISEETKHDMPWKCIYDGKPLSYVISPLEYSKGTMVKIGLCGKLYGEFESMIVFRQEKSGKEIVLNLIQDNDSIRLNER